MSKGFVFKEKEYITVGDISDAFGKFSTFQENLEFLDAYYAHFSGALSNLRYMYGMDPYLYLFTKNHPLNSTINSLKKDITDLESEIYREYTEFMKNRK